MRRFISLHYISRITLNLFTANPCYWLEIILSFLKMFSMKKAFIYFFQCFRKSARKSKSKGRIFKLHKFATRRSLEVECTVDHYFLYCRNNFIFCTILTNELNSLLVTLNSNSEQFFMEIEKSSATI